MEVNTGSTPWLKAAMIFQSWLNNTTLDSKIDLRCPLTLTLSPGGERELFAFLYALI
jgi:hypothetical protein